MGSTPVPNWRFTYRTGPVRVTEYSLPDPDPQVESPTPSSGGALASDDVWIANNHAQKNVDQFIPLSASPYAPVEFDYSVHNEGLIPEIAYLEPDQLPYGMKLTVSPKKSLAPSKQTVITTS